MEIIKVGRTVEAGMKKGWTGMGEGRRKRRRREAGRRVGRREEGRMDKW